MASDASRSNVLAEPLNASSHRPSDAISSSSQRAILDAGDRGQRDGVDLRARLVEVVLDALEVREGKEPRQRLTAQIPDPDVVLLIANLQRHARAVGR